MTTSLKRRSLSKPKRGTRVPQYDLAFVRARNRNNAHSYLLEEFADSGVSKSDLAKMLGKRPEQITRWLAGPSNLTLDTLSDLVFALRGAFVSFEIEDDFAKARTNHRAPEWIKISPDGPQWRYSPSEIESVKVTPVRTDSNKMIVTLSTSDTIEEAVDVKP